VNTKRPTQSNACLGGQRALFWTVGFSGLIRRSGTRFFRVSRTRLADTPSGGLVHVRLVPEQSRVSAGSMIRRRVANGNGPYFRHKHPKSSGRSNFTAARRPAGPRPTSRSVSDSIRQSMYRRPISSVLRSCRDDELHARAAVEYVDWSCSSKIAINLHRHRCGCLDRDMPRWKLSGRLIIFHRSEPTSA
jgi:hypothetical protein